MAEEQVKYFTLKLNYLQFETVRNLFNHSGWDFEECLVGPNKFLKQAPAMIVYSAKMTLVNHQMSKLVAAMMGQRVMMLMMSRMGSRMVVMSLETMSIKEVNVCIAF